MNIYTNKETEEIILKEAAAKKTSKSEIVREAIKLYSDFKKTKEFENSTEKIKSEIQKSGQELTENLEMQTNRLAQMIFKVGLLAGQNLYEQSYQIEQTFFKKGDGSVNEIKSKDFSKIARNWAIEFMKKSTRDEKENRKIKEENKQ